MIYDYSCIHCDTVIEKLVKDIDQIVQCPHCESVMKREMATPAFRFANGNGTSLGGLMSIASNPPKSY